MWRDGINEIRLHPGRFVATLLAIAISVGFLAAISLFVNTEQNAQARSGSLSYSTSDLVVTSGSDEIKDLSDELAGIDGVSAVYPVIGVSGIATKGDRSSFTMLLAPPPEEFRWAKVLEGRLPEKSTEIALASDVLDRLGAKVGDQIELEDQPIDVVGKTDDPRSTFFGLGYLGGLENTSTLEYGLKLANGYEVAQVKDAVLAQVDNVEVKDANQMRLDQLNDSTGGLDIFKNVLQGFGAVALLVGAITITNTFTILLAQRRRQIALLRAVGASTRQVSGRLLIEALLLGVIGSFFGFLLGLGVAAAGALYTGALYWGMQFNLVELGVTFLAGVLTTLAAAVLPSLRATRVAPIEALQAVPSAARAKRIGVVRIIFASLFLMVGVGLILISFTSPIALVWALGGGVLLSIAVMLATPLYVPPILRGLSLMFGKRPTARLALLNAARNPARASATATALILAVGLIVTLQVGIATARTSGMVFINERYPIDIAVEFSGEMPADAKDELAKAEGVERVVVAPTKQVEIDGTPVVVRDGQRPESELGKQGWTSKDSLLLPSGLDSGQKTATIDGQQYNLSFSDRNQYGLASSEVFDALPGAAQQQLLLVKMTDRTSLETLNRVLEFTEKYQAQLAESGAVYATVLETVLNVLLAVLTALLGVAVLIALVGVGNTLGLSVLERQRESALLRALGMQRRQLRSMLLVEAVALVAVGVLVGVLAGLFFGWLGVSSTLSMIPEGSGRPDTVFSIDVWWTCGLILVCLAAACLASVLPGRKAANATPTEALAVE